MRMFVSNFNCRECERREGIDNDTMSSAFYSIKFVCFYTDFDDIILIRNLEYRDQPPVGLHFVSIASNLNYFNEPVFLALVAKTYARQALSVNFVNSSLKAKQSRSATSFTMASGDKDARLCGVEYPVSLCRIGRISMECRH